MTTVLCNVLSLCHQQRLVSQSRQSPMFNHDLIQVTKLIRILCWATNKKENALYCIFISTIKRSVQLEIYDRTFYNSLTFLQGDLDPLFTHTRRKMQCRSLTSLRPSCSLDTKVFVVKCLLDSKA